MLKKIQKIWRFFFNERNINGFVSFSQKYYWLTILVVLMLSVAAYFTASRIKYKSDFAELLPETSKSAQVYNEIKKRVGGIGVFTIVVENENPEKAKEFLSDLVQKLNKKEDIDFIFYKLDKEFFVKNKALYAELPDLIYIRDKVKAKIENEKLKASGFYFDLDEDDDKLFDFSELKKKYTSKYNREYLSSSDEKIIVAILKPIGAMSDIKFYKKLISSVQNEIDRLNPQSYDPSLKVQMGGNFKNQVRQYDLVLKDIGRSGYLTLIFIAVILLLYFRNPFSVMIILAPLLLSVLWNMAFVQMSIGYITTFTGFIFAVLAGLGDDYVDHMYARYKIERKFGFGQKESMTKVLMHTGRTSITAAITASMAFFALVFTQFRAFNQFGFIAGVGILIVLFFVFFILPSFIFFAEKIKIIRFKRDDRIKVEDNEELTPKNTNQLKGIKFAPIIMGICVLLTVASVYAILAGKVKFEYDFRNLSTESEPADNILNKKTRAIYGRSLSPLVVLGNSREDMIEVEKVLSQRKKEEGADSPIKGVWVIDSFLPKDQDAKIRVIGEIKKLLEDDSIGFVKNSETRKKIEDFRNSLNVTRLDIGDLPSYIKKCFSELDGSVGHFAFVFSDLELQDVREATRFADSVREVKTSRGTFYASGNAVIFSDMMTSMINDGKKAAILTFIVVFFLVLLDLRSLRKSLVIFISLISGILWMFLIMAIFGIKLGFFNMVVTPILIGMGIDGNVYIYHRYRELGPNSLWYILKTTGATVFVAVITTMVGFASLIFAVHKGLNSIGILAVLGLTTVLIANLTFLPSMLQLLENRKK